MSIYDYYLLLSLLQNLTSLMLWRRTLILRTVKYFILVRVWIYTRGPTRFYYTLKFHSSSAVLFLDSIKLPDSHKIQIVNFYIWRGVLFCLQGFFFAWDRCTWLLGSSRFSTGKLNNFLLIFISTQETRQIHIEVPLNSSVSLSRLEQVP